jgi:transglutaminase-like putative cysteine protease
MRLASAVLVFALLAQACAAAWAQASPEQQWMSVRLGGRKVGHLLVERRLEGGTVTTTQTMALSWNRGGDPQHMDYYTRSVESADGQPRAFASRLALAASASTVEGERQADGRFQVESTVAGTPRRSLLDWPAGALLAEGQRLAMLAAEAHPGQRYRLASFVPASQQVVDAQMEVLGDEYTELPGGAERLSHQRQTLRQPQGVQTMDLWLDARGIARKGLGTLMGQPLEMLACDRACALAPEQPLDVLRAAMADSPRPLTPPLREAFLRYRIHVDGDAARPLVDTGEQHVRALGGGDWQVDVGDPQSGSQSPPQPEDSRPNPWLPADDPAIRQLAAQAVGHAGSDRQKMRRLRSFVSGYVTRHGLDVGYASALEVARSRQGDCTEFALLLAALARSQGIPARVVTGAVYAERYAGASRVFVPHAWTQAWVDGRWVSYDAALRRFDSGHLALASGDGDPWHVFDMASLLKRLRIESVTPSWELAAPVAPQTRAAPASETASR